MSMSRIRGWRFWAITVAVVVIAVPVLRAQSENSVPGLLGHIITMLQSVQQSLDGLTHEEGNVLFTPPLEMFSPDRPTCIVANVSSARRNVNVQIIKADGTVAFESTVGIPPLASFGLGGLPMGRAMCRFEVLDGVKSDVRAAISLSGGGSDKDGLAAQ